MTGDLTTTTPRFWKALGYLLGLPAAALLFFFAKNEYFLPTEMGRLLLVFLVVGCLIYRLITKRAAHTLFFATVFLALYNFILVLGGTLFLGKWAPVWFGALFFGCLFLLRGVPLWMRPGIALVLIALAGILALRQREFSPEKCDALRPRIDPVFHRLDDRMHAYDFAVTADPPQLAATFGLGDDGGSIATYDLATLERKSAQKLPWRGVQRLTPHPDGRNLFAAAWGHWETDRVMAVVDPSTGRIPRTFSTTGCRNAFEVAYDHRRDRFYLLCEASHNILVYDFTSDQPVDLIALPGWNSYDLLLDREGARLYVSDWLSPNLSVIRTDSLVLERQIPIGWTAFGLVQSPDGKTVLAARPLASEVVVVDPNAGRTVHRLKTDFGPRDLEVDPKRNLLFVGNYFAGTVEIFDLAAYKRLGRYYAGELLRGMYFDVDGDRLFLATGCGLLWARAEDLISGK